jgi:hypothetical protein
MALVADVDDQGWATATLANGRSRLEGRGQKELVVVPEWLWGRAHMKNYLSPSRGAASGLRYPAPLSTPGLLSKAFVIRGGSRYMRILWLDLGRGTGRAAGRRGEGNMVTWKTSAFSS